MSLKAYQKAQSSAEDPRNTEYRLFGQVTGALMDAQRMAAKGRELVDALDWNRRLWSALAVDCVGEENRLPPEVRAQIISLSIWVSKYSTEVAQGASLDPLIDINKTIMQGLKQAA